MQIAEPISRLITQIDIALVMPCFIILLVLLYLNRGVLRKVFQNVGRRTCLYLVFLFISSLLLRVFLSPRHYMIIPNEAFLVSLSKSILMSGSLGTDVYYSGWPFLASSALGFFGLSNLVPIYLNILLGSLTPLLMFLAAYLILGSEEKGLGAAALITFAPPLIIWSGNAEIYTSSIFFIILSILLSFLYFKRGGQLPFLLALSSLVFTSLIRPENCLFIILFGFGLLLFRPIRLNKLDLQKAKRSLFPLLVLSFIFFISCLRLFFLFLPGNYVQVDTYGTENAPDWSLTNLVSNSERFGGGIFTFYHPLFVVPGLLLGLILMALKKRKECLFLLAWLLLLYLANYASWETHFVPGYLTRQHMQFIPAITLFISFGLEWVGKRLEASRYNLALALLSILILTVILLGFLSLGEFQERIDPNLKLEMAMPTSIQEDINEDCVIISPFSEMLEPDLKHTLLSIEEVMDNPSIIKGRLANKECVLFYESSICKYSLARLKANVSAPPTVAAIDSKCAYMFSNFSLSIYKKYSYKNTSLILWQLSLSKV